MSLGIKLGTQKMKTLFLVLWILLTLSFGKETKIEGKDKTDSESDQKSDDVLSNQVQALQ